MRAERVERFLEPMLHVRGDDLARQNFSGRRGEQRLDQNRDVQLQLLRFVIDAEKSDEPDAGERAGAWLARHGVKATVQADSAAATDIGNVILSRAADAAADLVVMGIYGHSRMREFVLGGASRTLLGSMTVPLLIAH